MSADIRVSQDCRMKRTAAGLLWFFAGWCIWAALSAACELTPLFGPVLGATLAAFVAGDPMHRIWGPRVRTDRINARLHSLHAEA